MTPWQLSVCVEGESENISAEISRLQWAVWHTAALPLFRKFPKFADFIKGQKKPVKVIDETAIIAQLKAHNARLKNDGQSSKT